MNLQPANTFRVLERRYDRSSTGDILRTNVADGTPLGEVAQAYLDSGELVPDQVVVAMMLERLGRPDCGHGFLLDGFRRSVAEESHGAAWSDPAGLNSARMVGQL